MYEYGVFVEKHIVNTIHKAVCLLLFFVYGCGGGATNGTLGNSNSENRIPTLIHEKINATAPSRPDWINEIPADTDGKHFMVGLSEFVSSEKSAREIAMKAARAEYARYTGVEVSEIDEVARFLEGQESQVLDALISGQSRLTQKTDARVSRIKAKTYYIETFSDSRDGEFVGNSYKCWVLVFIPIDEDRRVAEWRAHKLEQLRAATEQKRLAATEDLARLRERINEATTLAQDEINQGRLVSALGIIQQQLHVLAIEKDRFLDGNDEYRAYLKDLELLKVELDNSAHAMAGQVIFDSGRFGGAMFRTDKFGESIPVWAWLRASKGSIPAIGLPLVLMDSQGSVVAEGVTESSGKAKFQLSQVPSGAMFVKIDERAWVSQLSEEMQNAFEIPSGSLNLIPVGNDLSGSIKYAVQKLFLGSMHAELIVKQVLLGPVTYHTSDLGGEFSELLKKHLRLALNEVDGLTLIEPKQRSVDQIKRAVKTRGVKLNEVPSTVPSIGSSAMQAVMDGAQASLEGTYVMQIDGIRLDLSLHQAGTDVVMASSAVTIPLAAVNPAIEIVPPKAGRSSSKSTKRLNSINVEITSDYGNGQTYKAGEKVSYFVHIDRDAYLLMVYEDAAGNLLQIYPNKRSSNQKFLRDSTIKVPGENDPFEFEISAPFGREQVLAFASTDKFPELSGIMHSNGLKVLNINLDSVLKMLRKTGSLPSVGYGEARTLLTTVPL